MFEYLVSGSWNCLDRITRCGLAGGGLSLWMGFRVSKPHTHHSEISVSGLCFKI